MSCNEVPKSVIDKICSLALGFLNDTHVNGEAHFKLVLSASDCDSFGRRLMWLNKNAFEYRYKDQDGRTQEEIEAYSYPLKKYSPIECLKACECWMYQCSESDDLTNMELWQSVRILAEHTRTRIVSSLPEYKAAKWGE